MERPNCIVCGKPAHRNNSYKGKTYWQKLCATCLRRRWLSHRDTPYQPSLMRRVTVSLGLVDSDLHQCGNCKQRFPFRCEVHHKNKDREDNTQENLLVLCPNCHTLLHHSERTNITETQKGRVVYTYYYKNQN